MEEEIEEAGRLEEQSKENDDNNDLMAARYVTYLGMTRDARKLESFDPSLRAAAPAVHLR